MTKKKKGGDFHIVYRHEFHRRTRDVTVRGPVSEIQRNGQFFICIIDKQNMRNAFSNRRARRRSIAPRARIARKNRCRIRTASSSVGGFLLRTTNWRRLHCRWSSLSSDKARNKGRSSVDWMNIQQYFHEF